MSLSLYKQKRDFKNTPEPTPHKANKKPILTFVVQRHDASHLHYDFRLEMDGVLKSWAVPKGPSMKAGEKRLAVMVEDHPFSYGKFYGEIPKGNYGAGTVDIWDSGMYTPMEDIKGQDAEKLLLAQLKKGDLKIHLKGKHLKGNFALVRMHGDTDKNWLLIKKDDEHAVKSFNIEALKPIKTGKKKATSVTGSSSAATAKTAIIKTVAIDDVWQQLKRPMMATLSTGVIDNANWLYEIKYDGYRAITKVNKGEVEMVSRNGINFNKPYSPLIDALKKVKHEVILDGEIVIEDGSGRSDFQLLQNYTTTKIGILKYYVFDILFLSGVNLTNMPLKDRKELLDTFFQKYKLEHVLKCEYIIEKGNELFEKLVTKGYEGIIAKDTASTYLPGKRTSTWLKVKQVQMQEVIICGYTLPQNSRKYIGSLILGIYDHNILKYVGNCGTGFTDATLKQLHTQFEKLKTDLSPFADKVVMIGTKGKPVWLKPKLVCNVKFFEWTVDNHLRLPVFMGLRTDKLAEEVVKESPDLILAPIKPKKEKIITQQDKIPAEEINHRNTDELIQINDKSVKCTNITKVYWPDEGITKGDLIHYYKRTSQYILPYLKDRPQSLNRFPNGITGQSFYQKDMDVAKLPSWLKTVKIYSKSNKTTIDYLICNDAATLLYMGNLGCIEINPWHSTYTNPDYPDYTMLDLDPGNISFVEVVNTALVIKEICDELQMDCFCKTSGATGLHIYIPMGAKYTYDQVKLFTELLATITQQRLPNITSLERKVDKRADKIYIDFLQNRKGQTIASAYSVRPQPHATVSTPLLWKEVTHQLTPEMFTIYNIEKRLDKVGDLWKGVLGKPVPLDKILKRIDRMH